MSQALPLMEGGSFPPPSGDGISAPLPHTFPTYDRLFAYHFERIQYDGEGNLRPGQSLKNQRSNLNKWLEFNLLNITSPVGEELGARFGETLPAFVSGMIDAGRTRQTADDRKSSVLQLRDSFVDLIKTCGLPWEFSAALRALVDARGCPMRAVEVKTGMSEGVLGNWVRGMRVPCLASLEKIRRLEEYFGVPRGTLSSRLPEAWWAENKYVSGTTPWRKHLRAMIGLRYVLRTYPPRLEREWDELLRFYTDFDWVEAQGMERSSGWRIRWDTGRCETGKIKRKMLSAFAGYLCLPAEGDEPRMRGQGFDPAGLSLALLSDASLVKSFLRFIRLRNVTQSYNSATKHVVAFACQLLRPETGYLWQRPEYGDRLPRAIPPAEWRGWCERNRMELRKFLDKIRRNPVEGFKKTRDPFAGVRRFIEERQHPISALFEVVKKLESLTPLRERRSRVRLAVHCRHIFHLRFIASNPLRVHNFAMMTYIPKDPEQLRRACEEYARARASGADTSKIIVETDRTSNLYQDGEGCWRLRFDDRDFKVDRGDELERGTLYAPYDVKVVRSVWPSLRDYLFRHRPVLNDALRKAVVRFRLERGVPALPPVEEAAIEVSPYVFRHAPTGIFDMTPAELSAFKGAGQILCRTLSLSVLVLTQKYLPDRVGFSPHACRHLVATEYIKNNPDGEAAAAAALHNSVLTVRKHYAWVRPADRIKPWNDYHEDLLEKYESGDA